METSLHRLRIVDGRFGASSTRQRPPRRYRLTHVQERRHTAVMRRTRWSSPQGKTADVLVKNPEQLRNFRTRVHAEIVYTGAVAISIAPCTGNVPAVWPLLVREVAWREKNLCCSHRLPNGCCRETCSMY